MTSTLDGSVDGMVQGADGRTLLKSNNVACPSCGKHNFTDIRQFNLMFKTFQGVTEDAKNTVYLKTGDSTGYFRKLQECTENIQKEDSIWYRTDR